MSPSYLKMERLCFSPPQLRKWRLGRKQRREILEPGSEYQIKEMIDIIKNGVKLAKEKGEKKPIFILEHVHAVFGDSGVSLFSLGEGFGIWKTAAISQGLKLILVEPAKWKKALKLSSDKNKSRELAIKIFPQLKENLKFKKDHDLAESLLIGYYAKEFLKI